MTPPYVALDVPATTKPWTLWEIARLRAKLVTDTVLDGAALRWKSNNRCVPDSTFQDAFCEPSAAHVATCNHETDVFINQYRERMKNHVHSAEELFEMRSAFGPNTTVVNVITGRKTKL